MEDSLQYFYGLYPSVLDAPEKVGDELEISKLIHGAVVKYRDTTIGMRFVQGSKRLWDRKRTKSSIV